MRLTLLQHEELYSCNEANPLSSLFFYRKEKNRGKAAADEMRGCWAGWRGGARGGVHVVSAPGVDRVATLP